MVKALGVPMITPLTIRDTNNAHDLRNLVTIWSSQLIEVNS